MLNLNTKASELSSLSSLLACYISTQRNADLSYLVMLRNDRKRKIKPYSSYRFQG
jgi:hypothetical protein